MYGDVPPLTFCDIAPVEVPLQVTLVTLNVEAKAAGSVIVSVFTSVQALLSVIVTE